MITLAMVLAMMAALDRAAPSRPSAVHVAEAILRVVDYEHPVFGDELLDAAVLVEIGYRESRWLPGLTGDHGLAICEYQIQRAPKAAMTDIDLCTGLAYARLRQSAAACPDAPLAVYTGGSCTNRTARRVSAFRMHEAGRIEEAVDIGDDDPEERAP